MSFSDDFHHRSLRHGLSDIHGFLCPQLVHHPAWQPAVGPALGEPGDAFPTVWGNDIYRKAF